MKKILIIQALLLLAVLPTIAQKLKLQNPIVNVGRTGYQSPITAVFEFKNKGGHKMRIESVQPDCYCTTVDYPKGELGEKFQVRMTYDARQLGHFNKQAAIYTSGSKNPVYICMTGVVLEHYVDFSAAYPINMDNLLLDKAELEFDDINQGDRQEQILNIYNNGTKMCRPILMHLPSYLTAVATPEQLEPGQAGTITVTLNSLRLRDYGLTQSAVYLAANPGDKVNHAHTINVSAVLLPQSPADNAAQRINAPKMQLSKESVDVVFDGKKKKTETIDITNTGRSELNISSLQLFTDGLKVSLGKRRLRPGESTQLKITVLRDDIKKVRKRPRILMITNDPDKMKVTINIHANL